MGRCGGGNILTSKQVEEIRTRHASGEKQVALARAYGVSHDVIYHIIHTPNYHADGTGGFACIPPEQRSEIGKRGMKALRASGKVHRWTSEEAKAIYQRRRMEGRTGRTLTASDVQDIRTRLATGERVMQIARLYGVSHGMVCHIRSGKRWKDTETG